MTDILQAEIKLTPKGVLQRTATCPDHLVKSSKFLSEQIKEVDDRQRTVWVFQCKYLGNLNKHNFVAFAVRGAPKNAEQLELWKKHQIEERVGISQKKWQ